MPEQGVRLQYKNGAQDVGITHDTSTAAGCGSGADLEKRRAAC